MRLQDPQGGRAHDGRAPGRLPLIDALRGVAVLGMIVFHAVWDMADIGLIAGPDVPAAWQMFGNGVAALFLALSGFGLVLAQRRGLPWVHAVRRLGIVLATAMGLTLATWVAFPRAVIWFGILHCIAVGDALALGVLRAPVWIIAAAAAIVLAVPALVPRGWLHGAGWVWLGLPGPSPDTLDYRPLLPWAGFILIGLLLARTAPEGWLSAVGRMTWAGRGLARIGRHSLMIYVLHQAILYPALFGVAKALDVERTAWLASFEAECRSDCLQSGAAAPTCTSACTCSRLQIETGRLGIGTQWQPTDPTTRTELAGIARQCLAAAPR